MRYTFDYDLFLALNFDGGTAMDGFMSFCSAPVAWVWLHVLILWLVWRRTGWRGALLFVAAAALALGLSDMIAGIFKHAGLLENLWPSFPARLRPMHTPELEGLVHVVRAGGRYGTVSAHAATMTALAVLAIPTIRRTWFTVLMTAAVLIICYSRIYLAYHFPIDILLGMTTGLVTGVIALAAMRAAANCMRRATSPRGEDRHR